MKILLFVALLGALLSCASSHLVHSTQNEVPDNAGSEIIFNEKSATEPEHITRFIVTGKFLRIDYGTDKDDFILFDRSSRTIYNVVNGDESIMIIKSKNIAAKNSNEIQWEHSAENSHALMRSSNDEKTAATHHKLSLQGKPCYNIVSVDSVLTEETKAMSEFQTVLASELMKSYEPSDESRCFDAINVLDPAKRYSFGFPYREWSAFGYQRFMGNYRQKIIFPDKLFKLPENYRTY